MKLGSCIILSIRGTPQNSGWGSIDYSCAWVSEQIQDRCLFRYEHLRRKALISTFEVIGGMALFLFGVRFLSAGMEKLAGHRLQEWLDQMTNRPFRGAVFGAGATALLQSSSLLMVTMIGLINANLMTLEQAVGGDDGAGDWHHSHCSDHRL
jgi:hypothetical protein